MVSRLDRLFVLLETGSSAVTRRAAARQLGEIQRLHPNELHHLLSRITTYLHSSAWETRIAAGQAVEAVIGNMPQWDPPDDAGVKTETPGMAQAGRMTFQDFDMNLVLANGKHLMGSEGSEYDVQEEVMDAIDLRAKMALQRQQLNAKLGLDTAAKIGVDMSEIFSSEDLKQSQETQAATNENAGKQPVCEVLKLAASPAMSSREMNRARRKARQAVAKQRSRDNLDEGEEQDRKKVKLEEGVKQEEAEEIPDNVAAFTEGVDWPLESFCDRLCTDLFSASWETRHGCATALREVVRLHGAGAGKPAHASYADMDRLHLAWLEDVALRLLCVLALDRFGDFVSDQVVAPVRETCAQALGSVLNLMSEEGVQGVLRVLLQLLEQKEWEARHGGLLGIKYLLAVKQECVSTLLPAVFPHVLAALSDPMDDVGAVAASALIPVAPHVGRCLPLQVAPTVQRLWDLLLDQDELAAACNSFMSLLAAILIDNGTTLGVQPVSDLVPRLWPFLCHSASSVRRATLQTLRTLTADAQGVAWGVQLLQDALRHAFQRALVEPLAEIQDIVERVWNNLVRHSQLDVLLSAACPYVSTWLCLSMQPGRMSIDPALLIQTKTVARIGARRNRAFTPLEAGGSSLGQDLKLYLGGSETTPLAVREGNVMRARCMAARMIGLLSCYVIQPVPGITYEDGMESPVDCYVKVLLVYLDSKSALQRMMAGLVVAEGARCDESGQACPVGLRDRLHACLNECIYFDEIAVSFTRLLQEARDFIAVLKHYKAPVDTERYSKVLTLDQITQLSGAETQVALAACKLKQKMLLILEERRKTIQAAAAQTAQEQTTLNVATQAALAGAVIMLRCLPDKLNPVIKPLMEAVKREENEQLQSLAGEHVARLMELCIERAPCPNAKITANLCTFLRSDPEFTPKIQASGGEGTSSDSGAESMGDNSRTSTPTSFANNYTGILTLVIQQKTAERAAFRRSNSSSGRGPGRPPATDIPLEELFAVEDLAHKQFRIQRRGASFALTAIGRYFGPRLPEKLPKLWELVISQLLQTVDSENFDPTALMNRDSAAEELISSLQVLEVISPALHTDLLPQLLTGVPALCSLLTHPYRAVRHMSARCLAALALLSSVPVMSGVVARALPLLGSAHRQGAVEALACITDRLQVNVVPYIVLLVVPLLGCMSDQDQAVRLMATHCFATLIQLMPLDGGVPDPPGLGTDLIEKKARERKFLEQLFNPKTIEDYKVPVAIRADLRSYQQSGINWLAFLNKYKLHGILCDDMGLGKTLQSICMLAGDHFHRMQAYRATGNADMSPLPSLVICPPTLTGHWQYEVEKFLPSGVHLSPMQYAGPPIERFKLRKKVKTHNLIIASYDIIRKDIDFFSSIKWNYCILDEGHIIKNGKTKASKAVKQLVANHRLILSGTPIQNNVLELWSLFDFLMPGFLGTEKQFTARYSKPILASRDPKSQPKDQEAGALAMEALHRQVLPFLLRRMKEDVLQDLPPKITQDYYCDLSPLQQQLYEDFSRSQAHQSLQDRLEQAHAGPAAGTQTNTHIFQALRYLQNVCNHPRLVLTPEHPEYQRITAQLAEQKTSMADIQHSAKLPALQQLLLDCGIGAPDTLAMSPHRALIFCQLKAMLDIVEHDLLQRHMPAVSYLRLDGSIPPASRHSVVARFNSDPTIDVLLLTTQVGGLGLNLTGADTVIFVEHDWNPMKDVQAMDRAHRIGQKKVVNVYRLITRATLEEKIMGLQKFKLMTANTVISSENASMETMGTDQLLELFSLESGSRETRPAQGGETRTFLDTLPELWEDRQYEEEYDMTSYVRNLRKQ